MRSHLTHVMPPFMFRDLSLKCTQWIHALALTRYWCMHGNRTTSVRVKYRPSANICSRWGRSVVFTFLMSDFSLVDKAGTALTDIFARAVLTSSLSLASGGCPGWVSESGFAWPSGDSLFFFSLCCWSFCLRNLSSLWTFTGSPSVFSKCRMGWGSCRCWLVGFWRCPSTAEGMSISHSLVHWLTWQPAKRLCQNIFVVEWSFLKAPIIGSRGNKSGFSTWTFELKWMCMRNIWHSISLVIGSE